MGGPGEHGEDSDKKENVPSAFSWTVIDNLKFTPPIIYALQERRWPDLRQFRILEFHIHTHPREALADKRGSDDEALEMEEQEDRSARSQYVIGRLDWIGLALSCSVNTKFHGVPNDDMLYFFLGSSNK